MFPNRIAYRPVATSYESDIKRSRYHPNRNPFDLSIHKTYRYTDLANFPNYIEYRPVVTSHESDIKKSRYHPNPDPIDVTIHKTYRFIDIAIFFEVRCKDNPVFGSYGYTKIHRSKNEPERTRKQIDSIRCFNS